MKSVVSIPGKDKGYRRRVIAAVALIAVGLAVILAVSPPHEGPLLLYINEQHAIRLVDAIGLVIAIPAWLYLVLLVRKLAIWSIYLTAFGCTFIFRGRLYPTDIPSLVISSALMVTGVTLFIISKETLRESHSTFPEARRLVTNGVYSRTRHPLYTGLQMVFWDLSLWFWSLVGVVLSFVLILPLHIWRARAEERVLVEVFGDEYIKYKANTLF